MFQQLVSIISPLLRDTKFENKVFFVGGCVRDDLLGLTPNDFDIVVNTDDGGLAFAQFLKTHLKINQPIIPRGYGVCELSYNDTNFEFTSMLREIKDNNDVTCNMEPTNNVYDEASRRDYTINAIYYDLTNKCIIDPLNGISDLKQGKIKSAKPIDTMLYEDPTRGIRVLRLFVKLLTQDNKKWEIINSDKINQECGTRLNDDFLYPYIHHLIYLELEKVVNNFTPQQTATYIKILVDQFTCIFKGLVNHKQDLDITLDFKEILLNLPEELLVFLYQLTDRDLDADFISWIRKFNIDGQFLYQLINP